MKNGRERFQPFLLHGSHRLSSRDGGDDESRGCLRRFQSLSLSSLRMGEPSPIEIMPAFA